MEEEVVPTSVEIGEEKPAEKTETVTPTEPVAEPAPDWFEKPVAIPPPQPVYQQPQSQWVPPPVQQKKWDWDAVISDPEGYRESLKAEARAEVEAPLNQIKQAVVGMYQEGQMREIVQAEARQQQEIARIAQDPALKNPVVASMMGDFLMTVRAAARQGDQNALRVLQNPRTLDLALYNAKMSASVPNTGSVSFKGGKVESGPTAANPQKNAKTVSPERAAYFKKWNIPQNEWNVEDPEVE